MGFTRIAAFGVARPLRNARYFAILRCVIRPTLTLTTRTPIVRSCMLQGNRLVCSPNYELSWFSENITLTYGILNGVIRSLQLAMSLFIPD